MLGSQHFPILPTPYSTGLGNLPTPHTHHRTSEQPNPGQPTTVAANLRQARSSLHRPSDHQHSQFDQQPVSVPAPVAELNRLVALPLQPRRSASDHLGRSRNASERFGRSRFNRTAGGELRSGQATVRHGPTVQPHCWPALPGKPLRRLCSGLGLDSDTAAAPLLLVRSPRGGGYIFSSPQGLHSPPALPPVRPPKGPPFTE